MDTAAHHEKEIEDTSPPPSPKYIVLDTNVLLRLLILDFGTSEEIGISALARKAESLIVLAPGQEDEFWRNASAVLGEHTKRWIQIARDVRKAVDELMTKLKAARALGILQESQEEALSFLGPAKQHLDKVQARRIDWKDFEVFADNHLDVLRNMTNQVGYDSSQIYERAERRVAMSNPPCREKKTRPLGDCMVWEVVLTMLERGAGECWFATADTDYSDHDDVHCLNRLLEREVRITGGAFRFLHEDRSLGLSPGSHFRVLTELTNTIPQHVTKQMRNVLNELSAISPVVSWNQLEDALNQLPYRKREILKLRLGIGDGYRYTQAEVAAIFKLSQTRIRQIEKSSLDKLLDLLGGDP